MMERIRLLIIEQNPEVRKALETRLSSMSCLDVLGSVADCDEANRLVEELAPDVILVEPKRLDGQGIVLCKQLVGAPRRPTVIILTSFYDEAEALLAKELGISLYLLKDIDSDALLKAIVTTHERHA